MLTPIRGSKPKVWYFLILYRLLNIFEAPKLGKPNLLIIDFSSSTLKTLGLLFPIWGSGVTVPISIKLKFCFNKPGNASAFLSKPAASPTGCVNLKFKNLISVIGIKI